MPDDLPVRSALDDDLETPLVGCGGVGGAIAGTRPDAVVVP
jgi:hypothetical protein